MLSAAASDLKFGLYLNRSSIRYITSVENHPMPRMLQTAFQFPSTQNIKGSCIGQYKRSIEDMRFLYSCKKGVAGKKEESGQRGRKKKGRMDVEEDRGNGC